MLNKPSESIMNTNSNKTKNVNRLSYQLSCPADESTVGAVDDSTMDYDQIVINLNVGGKEYCTLLSTLMKHQNSWLSRMFASLNKTINLSNSISSFPTANNTSLKNNNNNNNGKLMDLPRDSEGRYFIDRDGYLFQFVLDFLRNDRIFLPHKFNEVNRLKNEMEFYRLKYRDISMDDGKSIIFRDDQLLPNWLDKSRTITVGYQGTFGFGRDGLVDVKFRKLSRLLVAGHAGLCRWTFSETLNDSRDPERCSEDRYSSRFFLKHNNLEQAFECLYEKGFDLVGCSGSGTHGCLNETKPSHHMEESRWQHYNEFVFARRPFF